MEWFKMKKEDIIKYLEEKLGGKPYNGYNCAYNTFQEIQELFPKEAQKDLSFSTSGRQDFYVYYKKFTLFCVAIHKKMTKRGNGSSHWYYYRAADYVFNTFDIYGMDNITLEEALQRADKAYRAATDKEAVEADRIVELFKHLKKTYGLGIEDANTFLHKATKRYWSLRERICS